MIVRIGDNIISSLGFTTEENWQAVKSGHTGLVRYDSCMGVPEPFVASFIDKDRLNDRFSDICKNMVCVNATTNLEKAAILSVHTAAEEAQIDLSSPRVLFFFSSTKGNVHLLDMRQETEKQSQYSILNTQYYLWHSAQQITRHFKNPNTPVIISNACISGAAAQIAALRELAFGLFDYAVVIGADMLSKFIISGFQSFKALSPEPCRPFDAARTGLNLGEVAATIIYARRETCDSAFEPESPASKELSNKSAMKTIMLQTGIIRNDANHISGPSRTGEGCYRALNDVLQDTKLGDIAFINAHGTATPYNDNMEAIAITRTGLDTVPVNSLKGYFGHTLGAAGVLESIISMRALLNETILPTQGFEKKEENCSLNIVNHITSTKKTCFLKMLSGFGGCNAVLLFKKI